MHACITRTKRQGGCKSTASTYPTHADSVRCNREPRGTVVQPSERGPAIIEWSRKGGLWREPIIDRQDNAARVIRKGSHGAIFARRAPHDVPPAMEVE